MRHIIKFHLATAIIILLTLLSFVCCTSKEKQPTEKNTTATSDAIVQDKNNEGVFPLPSVPPMITRPKDINTYLSKHFWDLYDFSDTTLIVQPDITEQGFAEYIQLLNQLSPKDAKKSINTMLDKAKPYPIMYGHFARLYEKYFYDPNSPFRNEQLYTPVVDHLVESSVLPKELHEVFRFQQKMMAKNSVGSTATNFTYTLANGDKKMMRDLQSNYLILFFTNPGCPGCASTTQKLVNSEPLHTLFALNKPNNKELTVLSIYPDGNIDEWRQSLPSLPQQHWVNSYDDGEVIFENLLYDIKAIPTLYLLDKDKNVILKDVTVKEIEEYFMELN